MRSEGNASDGHTVLVLNYVKSTQTSSLPLFITFSIMMYDSDSGHDSKVGLASQSCIPVSIIGLKGFINEEMFMTKKCFMVALAKKEKQNVLF